jgi:hypothetical protein
MPQLNVHINDKVLLIYVDGKVRATNFRDLKYQILIRPLNRPEESLGLDQKNKSITWEILEKSMSKDSNIQSTC